MTKICDAIRDRKIISFYYKGRTRVAEPHLVGYDRDGDLTLSAWQLSGGSGQGFRDFHINIMSNLTIMPQSFSGARPNYNPNDSTLGRILCRL
ncbi:WYL domain-containing protein [Qipengyuania sp. YG27]|uniref:WYL domain-containing protein n=1 Tax=Qipengyuania mesophila TaxID=2867246 RepID=A0ABS7JUW0_9SPHN|nr:WYL domain-containing protein [Qipengyuania mesophila]